MSVVGRVFSNAVALLVSLALLGCGVPMTKYGTLDQDVTKLDGSGRNAGVAASGEGAVPGDTPGDVPGDVNAEEASGGMTDVVFPPAAETRPPAPSSKLDAGLPPADNSAPNAAVAKDPEQPSAAGVRDIEPAAGSASAPAAEPVPLPAPEPEKPSVDDNPDRLMGVGTAELTRMLGDPRFVRRDSYAQLWRYRSKSCILDLFLYRASGHRDYLVSHVETRHHQGGAAPTRECFGKLLLERRDQKSG